MNKERYFIISISYKDKDGNNGICDFTTAGNSYPNRKSIAKELLSKYGYINTVILNIIELQTQDYLDFQS